MRCAKGAALLPLLCLVAIGCNRKQVAPPPPKDPEVMVALPVYQEVTDYEDFTGRTDTALGVTIRARVTGYIDQSNFKEGDDVKEGDLLFKIDPRPYAAQLKAVKAQLAVSVANHKLARAKLARAKSLSVGGSVAPEELDTAVATEEQTKANIDLARANVQTAELNLKWTEVRAPFDGRISRRQIDPGNLVKGDDTGGQALTTIVRLDPIYVYFDVDERTMLKVRRLVRKGEVQSYRDTGGLPVYVGLADETGYPHQARLDFVDNRIDESTGTLRVRAILRNTKDRTYLFSPGQFVRIRFPVGRPYKALLVAERALGTDQGQKFIYVVVKKRNDQGEYDEVEYRQIPSGPVHKGLRVVVKMETLPWWFLGLEMPANNGVDLKPDERVVVSGLQRVRPKSRVAVKKVDMVSGKPLPWWNAWNYFNFPAPASGSSYDEKVTRK